MRIFSRAFILSTVAVWLSLLSSSLSFDCAIRPRPTTRLIKHFSMIGSDGNNPVSGAIPTTPRTFVSYNVYKGKAALTMKPIAPVFSQLATGSRVLTRDGGLLIEMAPMSGPREYDWTKKSTFLLDPTECGEILTIDFQNSESNFIHDPFLNDKEKAGQVTKKLKITPTPDSKGYFLSLQVSSKAEFTVASSSLSIPVSNSEFMVIRNLIQFCIPRFLGFDSVWDTSGSWETAPSPPPPPAYKVIGTV